MSSQTSLIDEVTDLRIPDLHVVPRPAFPPDADVPRPEPATGRQRSRRLPRSAALLVTADIATVAGAPALLGVTTLWPTLTTMVAVAAFAGGGLYRSRLQWSLLDDLPAVLGRLAVALVLSGAVVAVLDGGRLNAELPAILASAVAVVMGRAVVYAVVRSARRNGAVAHRTLLLGGGTLAQELAGLLVDDRSMGLLPVGYLDNQTSKPLHDLGIARLGSHHDIGQAIGRARATVILVTFGAVSDDELVDVLRAAQTTRCEVLIVPRLFEIMNLRGVGDHIGAIPVVRLRRPSHLGAAMMAKRAFDLLVSAAALVLLSPVLLACALAVRTTGPGVIFRQRRVGKGGRLFELYKFRSMQPAAETQTSSTWRASDDPRMTAVGQVLRRTSLDELPQLWNILRGDMTLVGPRPERPHFAEQFSRQFRHYPHRHRVPVGLTGMAQVSGLRGGDSSIALRARYDNFYIENWSLWGDVKVMIRTVGEVVRGSGS